MVPGTTALAVKQRKLFFGGLGKKKRGLHLQCHLNLVFVFYHFDV